ncbi:2-phosphosulfolactate phosphatase [Agromyces seonyuensis]|uniref:Probable 2-phosphosulfolactate phosphatase n=1 Tax=Agromyces seonyuensis TaxID=2662446 RepID=A0A6I4P8M7_9MICO|nr:2-phosphosulfolactate phosphatase [Agromyces seonyuensis]MWC00308.1 hypothetical protein [Agromyces seonyuensis]
MTANDAFGQAKYQVRHDLGAAGAERILPGAHVAVVVDVLPAIGADGSAGAALAAVLDAARDPHGEPIVVLEAGFRNRTAVARRILDLQEERGIRLFVAVVAAGDADETGAARLVAEDQLAAGAVIDALTALGIDHTSPEAAVSSAAFEGLRHALKHLAGAAGTGAALTAAGRRDEVRAALELDADVDVPERCGAPQA